MAIQVITGVVVPLSIPAGLEPVAAITSSTLLLLLGVVSEAADHAQAGHAGEG